MSIARKCDRCGNLYEFYPNSTDKKNYNAIRLALYTAYGDLSSYYGKGIDLCSECMNKFDMFMNGYEVYENMEVKNNGR